MSRYDYVKYDEQAQKQQALFKSMFVDLTLWVDQLPDGRAKSLVYTKLEEAYMWIGKSIRDDQAKKRAVEAES